MSILTTGINTEYIVIRRIQRLLWLLLLASPGLLSEEFRLIRVGVLGAVAQPETTYAARLVGDALSQLGYRMELIPLPGKRLMSQLNRGQIDGDLIRTVDLSRGFDKVVRVPEPIGSLCGNVYRLLERPDVNIKQSTHKTTLAIYNGAPGTSSFFLRHWPAVMHAPFGFLPQGVKMLTHERVDLIAVLDLDRDYLNSLTDRPLQPYARFHLEATYFHVNAKYLELVEPLAKAIAVLKMTMPPPVCYEGGLPLPRGEIAISSERENL